MKTRKPGRTQITPDPLKRQAIDDPTNRFMKGILAAVIEYEKEIRRRRVINAIRARARNGPAVRRLPTGYGAERSRR